MSAALRGHSSQSLPNRPCPLAGEGRALVGLHCSKLSVTLLFPLVRLQQLVILRLRLPVT